MTSKWGAKGNTMQYITTSKNPDGGHPKGGAYAGIQTSAMG